MTIRSTSPEELVSTFFLIDRKVLALGGDQFLHLIHALGSSSMHSLIDVNAAYIIGSREFRGSRGTL